MGMAILNETAEELVDVSDPTPGQKDSTGLSFREQSTFGFLREMEESGNFTSGGCSQENFMKGCLCTACVRREGTAQSKLAEGEEVLGKFWKEHYAVKKLHAPVSSPPDVRDWE